MTRVDLDWALPPYPPRRGVDEPPPLRIQVELGDLAQSPEDDTRVTQEAIERKRRALEANPNDALACNNLAWMYLTAPEALQDWKAALPLAQKAAQLDPGPVVRNTLGLAYYRAGRYREAVETLEPNLKDQVDWALAYDLYFLAMSHHTSARAPGPANSMIWRSDGQVHTTRRSSRYVVEFAAIQAEAAALLGVKDKEH